MTNLLFILFISNLNVEFISRYIKTSGNATVDHLSKYLAVRLALEEMRKNGEGSPINVEAASEKQYTIYIPTANNQFTVSLVPLLLLKTSKTAQYGQAINL